MFCSDQFPSAWRHKSLELALAISLTRIQAIFYGQLGSQLFTRYLGQTLVFM